jgi:alanine racemase
VADRRWAWAEVDLGAVEHNVGALKSLVGPKTMLMAVVKAGGYGHGAVQVAGAALAAGAEQIGVATIDEGLELRRAGITAPVLVLVEPPPASAGVLVRDGLTPTVFSREFAIALSKAAAVAGETVGFHLKVNTGLNRIGVEHDEAAAFVESLTGLPGIRMDGVFTHFATADVPGDWELERQIERFATCIRGMRDHRIDPGIVHAANTAATVLRPEARLDMVRCGIALYGLHPCDATRDRIDLRPAMAVKARVIQLRKVAMGEGVSYGFTYHAPAPATIATLPLGYADGVRRGLSNEMRVLIGGTVCRQVGRVCMDQLMVEVPRGLEVRVGDEAVLVGSQGGSALAIEEQSAAIGTINYEIACGYGARLHHRYLGKA